MYYCIVLYSIILYLILKYCTAYYCTAFNTSWLQCKPLYSTVHYCIIVDTTLFHYLLLCYSSYYYFSLNTNALNCIPLYLLITTYHCIALHTAPMLSLRLCCTPYYCFESQNSAFCTIPHSTVGVSECLSKHQKLLRKSSGKCIAQVLCSSGPLQWGDVWCSIIRYSAVNVNKELFMAVPLQYCKEQRNIGARGLFGHCQAACSAV